MNVSALTHLIPFLVSLSLMSNPTLTGDALKAQVEGDVRHGLRVYLDSLHPKMGWLVDVLWSIAGIKDLVVKAIDTAIPTAQTPAP